MLKLSTLASGSTGNSIYIGNKNTNILIDCGISGIKLQNALKSIGVQPQYIDAVFITHEHTDHINGVGVFSRRFNIPIYATEKTWYIMQNKIGSILPNNKIIIYPNEKIIINDLYLNAFSVPHDAVDPVCYNIFYNNIKISLLSDLGHVNDNILEKIQGCSALIIESNYNAHMLLNGSYPEQLKKRVIGQYGHISNETCASIICYTISEKLKDVILFHISKENNTKKLALSTVTNILKSNGILVQKDLNLHIANEYGAIPLISVL